MTLEVAPGAGEPGAGESGAGQPPGGETPENKAPAIPAGAQQRPAGAAGMSPQALTERLQRERAAAERKWSEALGFKTPAEAKAALEKAAQYEASEKERKLAELSEVERLKQQLAEKDARIAQLEAAHVGALEQVEREKSDRVVQGIAAQFLDPDYVETGCFAFRRHLETLPDEQVAKMRPHQVERWFKDYAAARPRLAKGAQDPAKPAERPAPARKPITTGAPPARKPAEKPASPSGSPAMNAAGKTALPNRPNSMNPKELAEHARRLGITSMPGMVSAPARDANGRSR